MIERTHLPSSTAVSSVEQPTSNAFTIQQTDEHAYFPVKANERINSDSPRVEKISHRSSSYNYGVPSDKKTGLSERGSEDKPRIQVVVRKRPMTKREYSRSEVDIIRIQQDGGVVLQELKVAVDLSKYIQEVICMGQIKFWYFYVNCYQLLFFLICSTISSLMMHSQRNVLISSFTTKSCKVWLNQCLKGEFKHLTGTLSS